MKSWRLPASKIHCAAVGYARGNADPRVLAEFGALSSSHWTEWAYFGVPCIRQDYKSAWSTRRFTHYGRRTSWRRNSSRSRERRQRVLIIDGTPFLTRWPALTEAGENQGSGRRRHRRSPTAVGARPEIAHALGPELKAAGRCSSVWT